MNTTFLASLVKMPKPYLLAWARIFSMLHECRADIPYHELASWSGTTRSTLQRILLFGQTTGVYDIRYRWSQKTISISISELQAQSQSPLIVGSKVVDNQLISSKDGQKNAIKNKVGSKITDNQKHNANGGQKTSFSEIRNSPTRSKSKVGSKQTEKESNKSIDGQNAKTAPDAKLTSGQQVGSKPTEKQKDTKRSGQQVGRKKPVFTNVKNNVGSKRTEKQSDTLNDGQKVKIDKHNELVKEAFSIYDNFLSREYDQKRKSQKADDEYMERIVKYLKDSYELKPRQNSMEEYVVASLTLIFQRWNDLKPFYTSQIKLVNIERNLPEIMAQLIDSIRPKKSKRDENYAAAMAAVTNE